MQFLLQLVPGVLVDKIRAEHLRGVHLQSPQHELLQAADPTRPSLSGIPGEEECLRGAGRAGAGIGEG